MAEQNTEAKLKNLLKQEKIQLWNPPYTEQDQQPGRQHMQVSNGEQGGGTCHHCQKVN